MAIARLQSIANVDLGDAEKTILALANLRNNIEHFAVDLPKQQADSIIGRTVPFLASFVSNELGRRFQLEIGDKVWQNLIRIQEYRDNAINTAKKMIASRDEQPYYCEACQEDTAIKVYYREDEWSLHSYNVSCLACLDLVSVGMVCLGCQKNIPLVKVMWVIMIVIVLTASEKLRMNLRAWSFQPMDMKSEDGFENMTLLLMIGYLALLRMCQRLDREPSGFLTSFQDRCYRFCR
jgi:hypothetical protein